MTVSTQDLETALPRLISQRIIEDRLAVSTQTIWRWRQRADDPFPEPIRFAGNHVRFVETEVLEWIERQPRQLLKSDKIE